MSQVLLVSLLYGWGKGSWILVFCFVFFFLFVCLFFRKCGSGSNRGASWQPCTETVGKLGWSIAHPLSSNLTTLIIVPQLHLFSPLITFPRDFFRVWLDLAWCVYLRVHGKEEETRVYVYAKEQETVCLSEPASQLAAAHSCSPKRQVATIWSGSCCNGIVRLLPSPRESCTSSLPDCLNFNHFKSLPCFHPPPSLRHWCVGRLLSELKVLSSVCMLSIVRDARKCEYSCLYQEPEEFKLDLLIIYTHDKAGPLVQMIKQQAHEIWCHLLMLLKFHVWILTHLISSTLKTSNPVCTTVLWGERGGSCDQGLASTKKLEATACW